jgi:hypothetical protein
MKKKSKEKHPYSGHFKINKNDVKYKNSTSDINLLESNEKKLMNFKQFIKNLIVTDKVNPSFKYHNVKRESEVMEMLEHYESKKEIVSFIIFTDGCIFQSNSKAKEHFDINTESFFNLISDFFEVYNFKMSILNILSNSTKITTIKIKMKEKSSKIKEFVFVVKTYNSEADQMTWMLLELIQIINLEIEITNRSNQTHICKTKHGKNKEIGYFNIYDNFVFTIENFFGKESMMCFIERNGHVLWKNEEFNNIFQNKNIKIINEKIFELNLIQNTNFEILIKHLIMNEYSSIQCEDYFINEKNLISLNFQKFLNNNGKVFGYLIIIK